MLVRAEPAGILPRDAWSGESATNIAYASSPATPAKTEISVQTMRYRVARRWRRTSHGFSTVRRKPLLARPHEGIIDTSRCVLRS
jgi:hypothetical protein